MIIRVNFLRAFCRNFTLTPLSGPRSTCLSSLKKDKTVLCALSFSESVIWGQSQVSR
ncbi:hypothetical protein SAMN04515619_1102 [Collimonas sp. OK412]|nr:hypothetical protein SAMN04515619_1102 [Collimonas sp. OK412]